MKIAVLASPDSWYARDLQRAAKLDHQVVILPFSQIQTELDQDRLRITSAGSDLLSFDAVIVRTMPVGSLEQVVFRMDALAGCEASGVLVVNPAKAIEAAVDKYLTSAKIVQAGLLSPRTCVCQTVDEAMEAFEKLGKNVVVKPLFGSEGRGITRVSDIDLAHRAFKLLAQIGAVMYLQEFIDHEGALAGRHDHGAPGRCGNSVAQSERRAALAACASGAERVSAPGCETHVA